MEPYVFVIQIFSCSHLLISSCEYAARQITVKTPNYYTKRLIGHLIDFFGRHRMLSFS